MGDEEERRRRARVGRSAEGHLHQHPLTLALSTHRVIHLHAEAPTKPALGAACNGCGVCCALEPCPLGAVLSLRRRGACRMLVWDDAASRYTCGALMRARGAGRWAERLVVRWIAAGAGCDADLDVSPAPPD